MEISEWYELSRCSIVLRNFLCDHDSFISHPFDGERSAVWPRPISWKSRDGRNMVFTPNILVFIHVVLAMTDWTLGDDRTDQHFNLAGMVRMLIDRSYHILICHSQFIMGITTTIEQGPLIYTGEFGGIRLIVSRDRVISDTEKDGEFSANCCRNVTWPFFAVDMLLGLANLFSFRMVSWHGVVQWEVSLLIGIFSWGPIGVGVPVSPWMSINRCMFGWSGEVFPFFLSNMIFGEEWCWRMIFC